MTIINNPKFPEIKTEILKKPEFNKLKFFHIELPLLFKISVDKQKQILLAAIENDIKKNSYLTFFKSFIIKEFGERQVKSKTIF